MKSLAILVAGAITGSAILEDGATGLGCPINLSLEVIGDKWSLVVLRDLMFGNQQLWGAAVRQSRRIAGGILASRLRSLPGRGDDHSAPGCAGHKQKGRYSPDGKGDCVPVMAALGAWGRRYLPSTPSSASAPNCLKRAAPGMWEAFRTTFGWPIWGRRARSGPTGERLQTAYEAVVREQAG